MAAAFMETSLGHPELTTRLSRSIYRSTRLSNRTWYPELRIQLPENSSFSLAKASEIQLSNSTALELDRMLEARIHRWRARPELL